MIKPTSHRCLPEVWHKFKELARANNRSANSALNMLIDEAIRTGKLPDPQTPSKPK